MQSQQIFARPNILGQQRPGEPSSSQQQLLCFVFAEACALSSRVRVYRPDTLVCGEHTGHIFSTLLCEDYISVFGKNPFASTFHLWTGPRVQTLPPLLQREITV